MCTWMSVRADITAHGKGVADWIPLTTANVYYDHPVSAPLDHALIIDFANETAGPGARVSVELSAESARELLRAIHAALDSDQAQRDLMADGETESRRVGGTGIGADGAPRDVVTLSGHNGSGGQR